MVDSPEHLRETNPSFFEPHPQLLPSLPRDQPAPESFPAGQPGSGAACTCSLGCRGGAEDERVAEGLGQRHQLIVEGRPIVVVLDRLKIRIDDMAGGSHFSTSELVCAPACGGCPRLAGNAKRDAGQPACNRLAPADRTRPPGQNQESRLGSVFGVFFTAQDLATKAQDHRPVPVDECCEGRLGVFAASHEEPVEQLLVGQARRPGAASEGLPSRCA